MSHKWFNTEVLVATPEWRVITELLKEQLKECESRNRREEKSDIFQQVMECSY